MSNNLRIAGSGNGRRKFIKCEQVAPVKLEVLDFDYLTTQEDNSEECIFGLVTDDEDEGSNFSTETVYRPQIPCVIPSLDLDPLSSIRIGNVQGQFCAESVSVSGLEVAASITSEEASPSAEDENENCDVNADDQTDKPEDVPGNRLGIKRLRQSICSLCDITFPTQVAFQDHINEVHTDIYPYPCSHCGKPFSKIAERKVHEKIHDPNRFKGPPKFVCEICGNKYHLKVSLDGHRRIKHFGYKKPAKNYMKKPVTQLHTIGVRDPSSFKRKDPNLKHPCQHCDRTFNMRCELRRHMFCHTTKRDFQCPLCSQPFARLTDVNTHIRRIHETPTPTGGPRPSRPKFLSNQPCPCSLCEKTFKVPSQLEKHMTVHTGEKNYECDICQKRFRLKDGLNRHKMRHAPPGSKESRVGTIKCRFCGKDGFVVWSDYRNHRLGVHRNIPNLGEIEKPFGCGICGKPHYIKEMALVCAELGHDPTTLRKAMFRHKCPNCPPEVFGFHSLVALRRHWDQEHKGIFLPPSLRKGMNYKICEKDSDSGNQESIRENLPSVVFSKHKVKELRKNGPMVKYEFPLVIEFDLLDMDDKYPRVKIKRKRLKMNPTPTPECPKCGLVLSKASNLRRHLLLHEKRERRPNASTRSKKKRAPKSRRRRRRKQVISHTSSNRKQEEVQYSGLTSTTVDVKNLSAVEALLGNKTLVIELDRVII